MSLKSPTGVWGKKILITGENKVATDCTHPGLLEKKEGELIIHLKESLHEPLILTHTGEDAFVKVRITAEANTEATIIEHVTGRIAHTVTVGLAENSNVAYGLIQKGVYKGKKRAVLERNAHMTWFELNTGTGKSRTTTELNEGASVRSNSIFLGHEGEHIDFGTKAIHLEPYTSSQLFTKGALRGAHAIYDGVLDIKKSAPHSEAHQKEDCLLLDKDAEMKAAPQLFIDNNEVKCSHAVSTTKPDEALAFYVQSRGVSEEVSDAMLIKAFVWPVVETLPQHLMCWVEKHVEEMLENFGNNKRSGDTHE